MQLSRHHDLLRENSEVVVEQRRKVLLNTESIPKERRVHCQPSKGIVSKNKMTPIYFGEIVGMGDVLISSIAIVIGNCM